MTPEAISSHPASFVMPLGPLVAPARALATACGAQVMPFDPAALAAALAAGQRGVVVWSPPTAAVAQALRSNQPVADHVAGWRQSIEVLLTLFNRNRRKLLLVDASLLLGGTAQDLANLCRRLPMPHPLPALPADTDLPALLAGLALQPLTDVSRIWDEVLACSVSSSDPAGLPVDLDQIAAALADIAAERTRQDESLARLNTHHEAESSLLRAAVADLSLAAEKDAQTLAQAVTRLDEARHDADLLRHEANLLREQLTGVTTTAENDRLRVRSALARANLDTDDAAAAIQHLTVRIEDLSSAVQSLPNPADHRARLAELALLRQQLFDVAQAMPPPQPTLPVRSEPGPDRAAELNLLRAQVVALSDLAAEPRPDDQPSTLHHAYPQIEAAFARMLALLAQQPDTAQPTGGDQGAGTPPSGQPMLRTPVTARPAPLSSLETE
jgi:hypothetical protein